MCLAIILKSKIFIHVRPLVFDMQKTTIHGRHRWPHYFMIGIMIAGLLIPLTAKISYSSILMQTSNSENGISIEEHTNIFYSIPKGAFDNNIEWDYVLHDSQTGFYRNPGYGTTNGTEKTGAVPVGQDVILRIRTLVDDVERVRIRYWDGMAASEHFIEMTIDSTADGYDYWIGTIPSPLIANDYYYGFYLIDGTDTDFYQDDQNDGGIGQMVNSRSDNDDWGIIFYDPDFVTPDWHKHTVGYQIFTDRFFNGETANDPQGDGSSGDITWWEWSDNSYSYPRTYVDKKEWGESPSGGNDYFGGDLQGVIQKVDYLDNLGIGMIWFNPISESPDNHGYSVNNYTSIQPYYGVIEDRTDGVVSNDQAGSLEVFSDLESDLAAVGIRVIYDAVINHASAQSYLFQRFDDSSFPAVPDMYPDIVGAFESFSSPYYNSFDFTSWPNDYDSWWGFKNIPTIIYDNPNSIAEETLITGDNSLFSFWQEHGVDGFRLDVPNMYQDGHESRDINQAIRNVVKANNPDDIIIGEIWDRANAWLTGTMQDGVQNMPFGENTISWLNGHMADDYYTNLLIYPQENYPSEAFYSLWTILGNHDTARIFTQLGEDINKMRLAASLQFTYPGVPMIYYGDEVGMTGASDPGCRKTFPWGNENQDILSYYQALIIMRNTYEVFQEGSFGILAENNDGIIAYKRELPSANESTAICVFNQKEYAQYANIPMLELPGIEVGDLLWDPLTGLNFTVTNNETLRILSPSQSTVILLKINAMSDDNITEDDDTSTQRIPFFFSIGNFIAVVMAVVIISKFSTQRMLKAKKLE